MSQRTCAVQRQLCIVFEGFSFPNVPNILGNNFSISISILVGSSQKVKFGKSSPLKYFYDALSNRGEVRGFIMRVALLIDPCYTGNEGSSSKNVAFLMFMLPCGRHSTSCVLHGSLLPSVHVFLSLVLDAVFGPLGSLKSHG